MPSIRIDVDHKSFQKLEYIREISLNNYIGDDNQDPVSLLRKEWVSGQVSFDGKSTPIKLRIKGQSIDHWGKNPSYKVKVSGGKTILGMKRFALQHPKTRGFMNEWYFHEFLKFNELIYLRYKFVNLSVNGDTRPIYALEENFDKRLIENNKRKDGLIFRIINQENRVIRLQQPKSEIKGYLEFGSNDLTQKLNSFFDNKIEIQKVFDIKSLAKLYAIMDLWGNRHAAQLKNIRFYYNPSTSLIEPIAYDQQVAYKTQILGILGSGKKIGNNISNQSHFFDIIFKNTVFFKEYIKQLEIISSKLFLDKFFEEIREEENKMLRILYKSYPYFEYKSIYPSLEWAHQDRNYTRHLNSIWLPKEKVALYSNQEFIKKSLKLNSKSATIEFVNSSHNQIKFKVINHENLAMILSHIKLSNNKIINFDKEYVINPKNLHSGNDYTELNIKIPDDYVDINEIIGESFVSISILGSKNEIYLPIHKKNKSDYRDEFTKYSDIRDFEGLNFDESKKEIVFDEGTININKNLVIAPGFKVKINNRTKINLNNNANIISYSSIHFIGSKEMPISINARGINSIVVINAEKKSIIENVIFNSLSALNFKGMNISGGINFYGSNVDINSCEINNSKAEDSINIIRAEFNINNCIFRNSKSDAIDIDFANGNIRNTNFQNIGNDAIDISGSRVNLINININGSLDKGISVGENSLMHLYHAKINNAKIGIAVKDKSILYIDKNYNKTDNSSVNEGLIIENCDYGIAIYQKKSEFGPAEVYIGNRKEIYNNIFLKDTNDHFIVEKGSFLEIGSQRVEKYENNVFKKIY